MNRIVGILAFLFLSPVAQAQTFSISGNLSLPSGIVAPSGGAKFTLSTDPLESFDVGGGTLESSITVTIAQNTGVASYTLTLKDDPAPAGGQPPSDPRPKKLRFVCDSGCDSLGVMAQGYWNETDGVVGIDDATEYTATQNFFVDIGLSPADVFSGVIKFPEGFTATGDETIEVLARASSFSDQTTFSQIITTKRNQTEWPFYIGVPRLAGIGGWTMEMTCSSCDEDLSSAIHYPTKRTGDPMTLESNKDFFFIKFVSSPNMTMTFISARRPTSNASAIIGSIQLLLLDDE